MTSDLGRALIEMLDLIDEAHPQPSDVFTLKSIVKRIIQDLAATPEPEDSERCSKREMERGTLRRQCRLDAGHEGDHMFGRRH